MKMDIDEGRLFRLVRLAQSAGLDQRKWEWFLQEMSKASGGVKFQLGSHDLRNEKPLGMYEYGYDPDYLDSYLTHYGALNPWLDGFAKLGPGKVAEGHEVLADEELEKTEFYNEWVRPQEDIVGGAGVTLESGPGFMSAFGANIRRVDRDRVQPLVRSLMEFLVPHLQQSLAISKKLGQISLENRVLRSGMDPDLSALFVLDSKGSVRFANARGETLCDTGELVRTDGLDRLRFIDPKADSALSRVRHDISQSSLNVALPFFASGDGPRKFICQTTPLAAEDGPYPWLGPNRESDRAFTLLILSPIAPRLDEKRRSEVRVEKR